MFEMANAPATTVLIHTCLRTQSNVHSVKGAASSESNLVAATRMTKVLVDVGKDAKARAKEEERTDPEASLRAPGMATQRRLKLLFIS